MSKSARYRVWLSVYLSRLDMLTPYAQAKELISQLGKEYNEMKQAKRAG